MDAIKPKEEQVSTPPPEPPKPKKKRRWKFFLFLLLLISGMGFFSFQLWQQLQGSGKESKKQIDSLESQVAELQTALKTVQTTLEKNTLLESRIDSIDKQQQILEHSLKGLTAQTQQQPQNSDDWALAEVAYLLTLANHRMLLIQDVDGTLTALKVAEERLHRLNNPSLLQVRTQLTKDINSLRLVKQPDVTGIAIQLAEHATNVENLPLLKASPLVSENEKQADESTQVPEKSHDIQNWRDAVHAISSEMMSLVKIRYNDEADTRFLTPTQRYLIIQNLRLALESARFSALRRDKNNFILSLQAVEKILKQHYDLKDEKVNILREDLKTLQAVDLKPQLPDISGALRILRRVFNAVPSDFTFSDEAVVQ